jgi:hypothetical protein
MLLSGCAELKNIPVQLYRAAFEVQKPALASARVLDAGGTEVKTLWKDRAVGAGPLTVAWDGRNEKGETLAGGQFRIVLSLRRWDLRLVGKFGGLGSTPGRFLNPQGLCAYPQGARLTVAVADTGNQRIQLLTDSGGFLQATGQLGTGDERLNQPTDVDWDGQIATVCDSQNQRLARFDSRGSYLGEVRQLTGLQTTLSTKPVLAFEDPEFIQKGGGGDFWISDPGQGILFHVTATGGILEELGNPFRLNNEGPFLVLPGAFWARNGKDRVQVLDALGNVTGTLETPFQSVDGMAAGTEGFVIVSDSKQGLLYLLDGSGRVFETLTPGEVASPGALSLWEDQLFLIAKGEHEIAHYRLEAAAPSELKKDIKVETRSLAGEK